LRATVGGGAAINGDLWAVDDVSETERRRSPADVDLYGHHLRSNVPQARAAPPRERLLRLTPAPGGSSAERMRFGRGKRKGRRRNATVLGRRILGLDCAVRRAQPGKRSGPHGHLAPRITAPGALHMAPARQARPLEEPDCPRLPDKKTVSSKGPGAGPSGIRTARPRACLLRRARPASANSRRRSTKKPALKMDFATFSGLTGGGGVGEGGDQRWRLKARQRGRNELWHSLLPLSAHLVCGEPSRQATRFSNHGRATRIICGISKGTARLRFAPSG